MRACDIVAALLETDDIDNPEHYVQGLNRHGWDIVELITTKEWRALMRSMGFRVISCRKPKGKRRYAIVGMTIVPEDGRRLDGYDEALVKDYIYTYLEQRFKKSRTQLGYKALVYDYNPDMPDSVTQYTPNSLKGVSYMDVYIDKMDKDDRESWMYLT